MKKKRLDEIKSKVPELEKGKKMAATGIKTFFYVRFYIQYVKRNQDRPKVIKLITELNQEPHKIICIDKVDLKQTQKSPNKTESKQKHHISLTTTRYSAFSIITVDLSMVSQKQNLNLIYLKSIPAGSGCLIIRARGSC